MTKTTTILIIMAILMLPIMAFAVSSENDEQTVAFGSQNVEQQEEQKAISPFTIIGIILLGLLYFKNKNGGKIK